MSILIINNIIIINIIIINIIIIIIIFFFCDGCTFDCFKNALCCVCCKGEENNNCSCKNFCGFCCMFLSGIFCCCCDNNETNERLRRIDEYLEQHSDANNYIKLVLDKEKNDNDNNNKINNQN